MIRRCMIEDFDSYAPYTLLYPAWVVVETETEYKIWGLRHPFGHTVDKHSSSERIFF